MFLIDELVYKDDNKRNYSQILNDLSEVKDLDFSTEQRKILEDRIVDKNRFKEEVNKIVRDLSQKFNAMIGNQMTAQALYTEQDESMLYLSSYWSAGGLASEQYKSNYIEKMQDRLKNH